MINTRYVVQLEANRDSDMFSYVEIDLLVHDIVNVLFPILILFDNLLRASLPLSFVAFLLLTV